MSSLSAGNCGRTAAKAHYRQSCAPTGARSEQTIARFLATGANSAAICGTGVATFETCGEIGVTPGRTELGVVH